MTRNFNVITDEKLTAALKSSVKEAGLNSASEYEKKASEQIAQILRGKPIFYRSFGPYWWIVKMVLIENGIEDFGTFLDAEWTGMLDRGNNAKNLTLALDYSQERAENLVAYSNDHDVPFTSEETQGEIEFYPYVINDEDMERMIYALNL